MPAARATHDLTLDDGQCHTQDGLAYGIKVWDSGVCAMQLSLAIEEHYGGEYLGYGYTHEDFMFTEATDLNHAWICARFCEDKEDCLFYETYTNHDGTADEDLSLCLLYGIVPDDTLKNDYTKCNDHPFGGTADSGQLDYGYTEEDIDHHPTMDHVGHYQFFRDGCHGRYLVKPNCWF